VRIYFDVAAAPCLESLFPERPEELVKMGRRRRWMGRWLCGGCFVFVLVVFVAVVAVVAVVAAVAVACQ
jgi:hypothetical protein